MTAGAEYMQPAKISNSLTKLDIRAPAGHVGGDGNLAPLTRFSYNFSLFFMMFGI